MISRQEAVDVFERDGELVVKKAEEIYENQGGKGKLWDSHPSRIRGYLMMGRFRTNGCFSTSLEECRKVFEKLEKGRG